MQNPKTIIIAQFLISLMMAFLMTGIFSFIELGFNAQWLSIWLERFLLAWPIAFLLSLVVSKVSFGIALKLTASRET
ncbi:DUF2798 domain-containing protein [Agarivorans sp. QJM3NY_33]|uniref:DUF2798 domain-containing protein n=1 Tax=Agarivorans sp. QJM3NY_33 TaxID=3421432 RepID=UPI003D7D796A